MDVDYPSSSEGEESDYGTDMEIEESDNEPINEKTETDDTRVQILKSENLPDEMNQEVAKLSLLEIPPHICQALLYTFGWDSNRLIEKFYEAESPQVFFKNQKIDVPPSTSKSFIVKKGDCVICCSDAESLIALACEHFSCADCWHTHLWTTFRSLGTAYVTCPQCQYYIDEDAILKLLTKPDEKEFYQRLVFNSFVASNPLTAWCPAADCVNIIKVKDAGAREVSCSCGEAFCFKCSLEPHEPLTCQLLAKWIKKYSGDGETMKWVSVNTKDCPKCNAAIEKNGGCNHMVCRKCNYEFCWSCRQDWKVHGYNSGCNRYEESKDAVDQASVFREKLKRYLHYYDRYANHRKSLLAEAKLKEQIMIKVENMQGKGFSWIETQFLKDAVDDLQNCRRSLMFAYPFAYYLPTSNNKSIFEDNQADLEHATEELSALLEGELDFETADLAKLKREVQDRARYVTKRRENMLQHCAEGINSGEWVFTNDE